MPSTRALKVFRTSAGFDDAYIAAPSQKAALEAWGTKRNLFAQGVAEVVKDPGLAKAALARPGEVLRVPRGTTAEHLAAAGASVKGSADRATSSHAETPQRPKKPRPNRDKLDAANDRLERARRDLQAQETDLAAQIETLKADLNRKKRKNAGDIARLQAGVEEEEQAYRQALANWEG